MTTLRKSTVGDGEAVLDIWRRAVDATHDFLSPEDRQAIEAEVVSFLPHVELDLAVDDNDRPCGFMFLTPGRMEALFIDPDMRGTGIGRMLVAAAVQQFPGLATEVNAQNAQAAGFYQRLGFVETGRSQLDGQGRPYPLIHLRHRSD